MLPPSYSAILKTDRSKFLPTKNPSTVSSSLMLGFLLNYIWVTYWQSFPWSDILDTLPFQTGAGGRLLRVLFARCSEWNFGEYYFQENFEDFKKAQSKKVVIPKNTVSCNSRCFWVSRRLVSFLESSEQISRFGAAFKKPPPKRRFLVHQQGLEPGTRWLRVSCSTNWAIGAHITL